VCQLSFHCCSKTSSGTCHPVHRLCYLPENKTSWLTKWASNSPTQVQENQQFLTWLAISLQLSGFKIAAGCRRQPALWPLLPAIFHSRNRKNYILSLDRQNQCPWNVILDSKRFISESNAAINPWNTHTYQKWIGWRFKSFLKQQQVTER